MKPCSSVHRRPAIGFSALAASYAASTSSIAASPTACVATRQPRRFSSFTTSVYGACFIVLTPQNVPPSPHGSTYGSRIQPPSNPPSTPSFMPPTRSHSSPSSGLTFERGDRGAHLLGAVGADAHQLADADRQQPAALHLLEQPVLLDRRARIADARQAGGVQLLVLLDERLDRQRRRRRQLHERLGAIDQLAVQLALARRG